MSRKKNHEIRKIDPEPIYDSVLVHKLINKIMLDGKKTKAEKIVYEAFKKVEKDTEKPALEVYEKALENLKPIVELKSKRLGGANYQIPVRATEKRQTVLSIRWLVDASRKRNEYEMIDRLANEIKDAYNEKGEAFNKKVTVHKMAEANRAFAQFSW